MANLYHYKILHGNGKPMIEILNNSAALQELTKFICNMKTNANNEYYRQFDWHAYGNPVGDIFYKIIIDNEKYQFIYNPKNDKNEIIISYGKKENNQYSSCGIAHLTDTENWTVFRFHDIPVSQINFDKYE